MLRGAPNTFQLHIQSHTGQPSTTFGASVTPGNNVYGSYVQLIDGATAWPTDSGDAFGIWITLHSNNSSTAARDTLVTVGIDPAGGTSYTDTINHLLCSSAGGYIAAVAPTGGFVYYFPLMIRRGSSVAVKASVNNATVGTLRAFCALECQPSRPELVRAGSFVRTFGADTATSAGTAITPGTVSEGAYVQLGAAVAEPLWFWDVALGCNNGTQGTVGVHADLAIGDATNKKLVIQDALTMQSTSEVMGKLYTGQLGLAAPGDLVYARAQISASISGFSAIAYAVGG